jgi:general secretion pathway protein D
MSIDWKAAAARGAGSGGAAGGPPAGMRIHDPAAFLQAIGEQGRVEMIAAPQVLAMNNEPAIVRVGTERVYFDVTSRQDGGRPQQTATPGSVLEGFALTVIPQIAGDGTVQLSVAPTYTENTGEAKSPVGGIYPVLRVSQADTNVRVQDGDTIVFSGFLRDRTRTKPATGVGSYFGAQAHERVRSELVVLLTPTIVTPGGTTAARLR